MAVRLFEKKPDPKTAEAIDALLADDADKIAAVKAKRAARENK